jgi:MscS family membrane protein
MRLLARAIALLLLGLAWQGVARADGPLAPLDTSSPSATMQSFASELAEVENKFVAYRDNQTRDNFFALLQGSDRIRQLFDMSELPPAVRLKASGEAIGYMIDILNRLPPIPPQAIPGAPGRDWGALPDTWTVPETEIHITRVKDGPRAGAYLFSPDTVARLSEFYARIIDYPPLRATRYRSWREEEIRLTGPLIPAAVRNAIPRPLLHPVLGTPLWKILFVAVMTVALVGVLYGWSVLASRLARQASPVRALLWHMTTPVLVAVLGAISVGFCLVELNLSGTFAEAVTLFDTVLLNIAAAWAAWLVCSLVVETIIASPHVPDDSYDANLLRLGARVCGPLAAASVLVYGASTIGVPALGLVAGLGVGGIALALAAQPTIENLIGGLTIFADRPFRVGDTIQFTGGAGRVETIGPRSTRIRGVDGTMTSVPNGDLAKLHITNLARRTRCLFDQHFGLPPDTPAEQLRALLEALRTELAAQPMLEKAAGLPRARLTTYSSTEVALEIQAYVLTTNWDEFLAIQEQLILRISAILGELGIVPVAKPAEAGPPRPGPR